MLELDLTSRVDLPAIEVLQALAERCNDGMLVFREGDHLVVCAVFEAKAGKSAARELSLKRNSISGLTQGERDELRACAKDVWREQRDEAVAAGKAFKKSVEDVEKEFIQSELGGQVRRDVKERRVEAVMAVQREISATSP